MGVFFWGKFEFFSGLGGFGRGAGGETSNPEPFAGKNLIKSAPAKKNPQNRLTQEAVRHMDNSQGIIFSGGGDFGYE